MAIKFSKSFTAAILSLILTIGIAALFSKSINYKTINMDDALFADAFFEQYNNPGIVKKIFTSSLYIVYTSSYYRPVVSFSFYIDSLIANRTINFSVNHTTNLLLHIFCVLLLFFFLKTYCFNAFVSFMASAIFASSIFSVYATLWLAGRNDSLLFIFILLSFIFFIKANESKTYNALFWILHSAFFIIAALTKENAYMLPVLCFAYAPIKKYDKRAFIYFIWIFLIAALVIVKTRYSGKVDLNFIFSFEIFKNNIYMLSDYFSTAFMLSKDEIHPQFNVLTLLKGFFVFALFSILAYFSKNKKFAFFFLLCPLILLAPNFLINRLTFQGSRFYLPFAFLITGVFYILLPLLENKKYRLISIIAITIFIFTSAALSSKRMEIFYDRETFYGASKNTQRIKSDLLWEFKCLSYYNFFKQADDILDFFEKKQIIDEEIVHNIILIHLQLGNYSKAIEYALKYEEFLEKDKDYYDMLIFCYTKIGDLEQANKIKAFSAAILAQKLSSPTGI